MGTKEKDDVAQQAGKIINSKTCPVGPAPHPSVRKHRAGITQPSGPMARLNARFRTNIKCLRARGRGAQSRFARRGRSPTSLRKKEGPFSPGPLFFLDRRKPVRAGKVATADVRSCGLSQNFEGLPPADVSIRRERENGGTRACAYILLLPLAFCWLELFFSSTRSFASNFFQRHPLSTCPRLFNSLVPNFFLYQPVVFWHRSGSTSFWNTRVTVEN